MAKASKKKKVTRAKKTKRATGTKKSSKKKSKSTVSRRKAKKRPVARKRRKKQGATMAGAVAGIVDTVTETMALREKLGRRGGPEDV